MQSRTKTIRHKLMPSWLIIISFIGGVFVSTQANAQSAGALDEIIVTAEKREQSLQEVPTAITAFGAQTIEDSGWRNIGQLEQSVPSLSVGGDGEARPFIFIRGVGTRKFDIGADGSIGVFVDEVYNARYSTAVVPGIDDIERIEVLKGPQGTLYGRNTIGGAISLYTKKPTEEFSGRILAAAGNKNYNKIGGFISGALTDKLVGRISLARRSDDGVLTETLSGKNDGQDAHSARLKLIANASDRLEIDFTAQYTRVEQDARLASPIGSEVDGMVPIPPIGPFPASIVTLPKGGSLLGVSPLVMCTTGHPLCQGALLPVLTAEAANGPLDNAADYPGFLDTDNLQLTLNVKYEGDNVLITSITNRTDEELKEGLDFDATRFNGFFTNLTQDSEQFSQELRFNSVDGGAFTAGGRLTWVAGLYYFTDDAHRIDNFRFGAQGLVAHAGCMGSPTCTLVNDSIFDVNLDVTNYAIYGQATYALTDALNLTVGVRYSDDEKTFTYTTDTNTPGQGLVYAPDSFTQTYNFDSTDPKITLDYHFTDDIMGYVTYATGYKSGGIAFANAVLQSVRDGFGAEDLETYEIGIKTRFLEDRLQLNAVYYQYDYTDQQIQTIVTYLPPVVPAPTPAGITENAGSSENSGFELDVLAALTENLTFNLSYTYQDAEFTDFDDSIHPQFADRTGNRLGFTPEHAYVVGLNYDMDLGAAGALTLRGEYGWKDDYNFDSVGQSLSEQEAFGVLNLAAIWDTHGHIRMRFFCDNCTDEVYKTQVTVFNPPFGGGRASYARTRRAGLEVSYNF